MCARHVDDGDGRSTEAVAPAVAAEMRGGGGSDGAGCRRSDASQMRQTNLISSLEIYSKIRFDSAHAQYALVVNKYEKLPNLIQVI